jgi:hypothetical protein
MTALVLCGAACSGGVKKSASTTTGKSATTSTTASTTTRPQLPAPAHLAACPKANPDESPRPFDENAGVRGLATKLVPLKALYVRVCSYRYLPDGRVTTVSGSPRVAAQLEADTNRLPSSPRPSPGSCPARHLVFFATFANDSQQVDLLAPLCGDAVSNGDLAVSTTPTWLDELQNYATPGAVVATTPSGLPGNDGGRSATGPTGPTGLTQSDRAECTSADVAAKGAWIMPAPHDVQRQFAFDHGQNILEPPTNTNPPIGAARAWQIATKFGLVSPPGHGRYQLVLANLTSIHNYLHHPVWVVIGRDVVTFSFGGPASPPGAIRPVQPPCFFGNTVQPIDAASGQPLWYESGVNDLP